MEFSIENGLVLLGMDLIPTNINLLIRNGLITEISTDEFDVSHKIDAKNCIVCPGFINGHTHIGDAIALDVGDGLSIDEVVKPPYGLKHKILESSSDEEIINAMYKSMKLMLETGTTTFIDYREGGLKGIELLKNASKDLAISPIILGRDTLMIQDNINEKDLQNSVKNLLNYCDGIAPSGFGEINDLTAKIITSECISQNKISSIHVAEHKQAQTNSIEKTGKTEPQRALQYNFQLLIHTTHPMNNDLDEISKKKTTVVCCPRSNGALSVGIPPIKEMLDKHINILLGTDNMMFNSPNLLREMEYTHKVTKAISQTYISPKEILKMCTTNFSKFSNELIGVLEKNSVADILVIKQKSKNPYLSIINRTKPKHIKYLIKKGNII